MLDAFEQELTVTPASKAYKAKALKKKAASFKIKVSGAKGKVSFKLTKGSKKLVSVSSSGKVTLKKGCKKGTYKVTVTAAAVTGYKAASKVVTIKVK